MVILTPYGVRGIWLWCFHPRSILLGVSCCAIATVYGNVCIWQYFHVAVCRYLYMGICTCVHIGVGQCVGVCAGHEKRLSDLMPETLCLKGLLT